jgi:hypothetical protein
MMVTRADAVDAAGRKGRWIGGGASGGDQLNLGLAEAKPTHHGAVLA